MSKTTGQETKRPSVASQMSLLKQIGQKPAAYLLGYENVTTFRSVVDVPRNPDGSYDAADLVKWLVIRETQRALAARKPSKLSDQDRERMGNFAWLATDLGEALPDVLSVLERIDGEFGSDGLCEAVRVFMDELRETNVAAYGKPTAQEIRALHTEAAEAEIEAMAFGALDYINQCGGCDRTLWRGEWRKDPVPDGWRVEVITCDKCN